MPAAEVPPRRRSVRGSPGLIATIVLGACVLAGAASAEPTDASVETLQRTVDSLRSRLGISRAVTVAVVPSNPRVFSVAPAPGPGQAFTLEIEAGFLATLGDDEVTAALAHELGHVWVATTRPYLQTERLANDIALRVVTRSSLVRVYRKMSAHTGMAIDEVALVGPELLKVTRRDTGD